ncbi:thioesterase family protein [Chelatococcus sp. SYSU_G07232]|uniref:Thioesterase family protein n=1 Tax=Chelatococcus albus TaxID=3047466 RepID=A0ABT7ADK5_9HYPH|nr:thioesterase family protein [Chelatococcus sp. SYSU_G07232]MDJ1157460.1 thioesterase family protein [Chelatococcus sp. SYSU_G07232]
MSERPLPAPRSAFRLFRTIPTRWMDNDAYGHVNNVIYYSYFDTAVNAFLVENGLLAITDSPVVGLVVETGCTFFASVAFPEVLEAGLRVDRLGRSSVRYAIGIFREGAEVPAAQGHFVHVYVDRSTQRPVGIPQPVRAALEALQV